MRLADLARYRQAAYRLLGEALRHPESERLATLRVVAEELRERPGPLAGLAVFPQWLELLRGVVELADGAAPGLDETYVRLFVVSPDGICPPVGSHYLAPDAPASVMAEIEGEYARAGLVLSAEATEPPDHIAVALDFMAYLCAAEADSWGQKAPAEAATQLDLEARFLERYLCRWLPAFAELIANCDADGFYARVTEATRNFAAHDLEIVTALAARFRGEEAR